MSSKKVHIALIALGIGIGIFFSGIIVMLSPEEETDEISALEYEKWAEKEGLYRLKDITEIQENSKHYIIYIDENTTIDKVKSILLELKLIDEKALEMISEEEYKLVEKSLIDLKKKSDANKIIENCFVKK
ncbi:MAG: hypothetical protein N4A40_00100 [Tissierellales bacterium]|jgi:hypothetical protein|nr:hypothetical protein [Tissierellales bacterium]